MKETRDSISDIWGERTPHVGGVWRYRVDPNTLPASVVGADTVCFDCIA